MTNNNGVFITPQKELEEGVYNNLIYKKKSQKIKQEISDFIGGLK